jgi:metal-responsive CopG/Arc/MetJ family transcriptional regulator
MEKTNIKEDLEEEDELEEETIDLDKEKHIITTTVNIPKDLLKQLGYIAVEEGVSRGEIIRRCIKEYLAGHNPKSKEDVYTGKVEKVKELTKKLQEADMEVTIEAEDLYPENIDKTIEQLEKAVTESEA